MEARSWTPTTPADKLKAAHEMLADVVQVLAGQDGIDSETAGKLLGAAMSAIRTALPTVVKL